MPLMNGLISQPLAERAGSGMFVVQATAPGTFFVGNNAQALTGISLTTGQRLYLRGPFTFWFVPGGITCTPLLVRVYESGTPGGFSSGGHEGPILGE